MGNWCARPGSNRHGLPPPSQDGASTSFATSANILEDLVGLEPTVTCVDGLRIRSLSRWGHWSVIGGSGWFRTTCARVKRPLHLQSGLTLRIHRLDGCGGQPRRFRRACRDGIAPFRQSRDSDGHVGLPSVGAPVRNRTCINRLSSGRTAIVLQERELVRFRGIGPRTTAMSRRYSASELKAHDWYPRLGSNERMSVCKTDALTALRRERDDGASGGSRTHKGKPIAF